jgi:hypothetical protein
MGGALLGRILDCFDDSFVRTARRLLALADVTHSDWLTAGATTALSSKRIAALADLIRADWASPLGPLDELKKQLHPKDDASLRVEAWALLQAMDRALGPLWLGKFRSEGVLRLEPGSLFPVGHLQLDQLLKKHLTGGTKLSPRPSSLNLASRFLEHLGMWSARGVDVRVEFHREVFECGRVAFCLPNAGVDPATFSLDRRETLTGDPGFYGLRPRDEEAQWSTIEALLEQVLADRADLVLFPELCMTEQLQERVRKWRDARSFAGGVLAGSAHLTSAITNRASLILGEHDHHHHKVNPYVLPKLSPFFPDEPFGRTEVLSPRRELVLHFFGTRSVALLVCKDFMDPDVLEALAALRPSVVLVAALSDTTTVFGDAAARLRLAAQSIALVANAPVGTVPASLAYLPLRNEADPLQGNQRFARGTSGYQLFALGDS